jgi:PKD repeat protein
VTYTWDFGDGETGGGAVVTHTYLAPGAYTATVTASNSAGSLQASTPVRVIIPAYLPLIPKN